MSLLREEQESNTARRTHDVADTGTFVICDSWSWGEVVEGEIVVEGRVVGVEVVGVEVVVVEAVEVVEEDVVFGVVGGEVVVGENVVGEVVVVGGENRVNEDVGEMEVDGEVVIVEERREGIVGVGVVGGEVAVVGWLVMVVGGGLWLVLVVVARCFHRPHLTQIGCLLDRAATGVVILGGTGEGVGGLEVVGEGSSGLALACLKAIDCLLNHLALFSQKGAD